MKKTNKFNFQTNPKVDSFFSRPQHWGEEFTKLRAIILECGLTEELKWGWPAYSLEGKNIVLMHGFKKYCALLFFKGVLMKDPKKILIQQTEHVQGPRQIRFTSAKEIAKLAPVLKAYVKNAIEVEKSGAKVKLKATSDFKMPEELQKKLEGNAALKRAFYALTPGRQRAYLFYFSKAKQSQTREARIEKCAPDILKGKGLND